MALKVKRMSAGDWVPHLKCLVLGSPGAGKTRFSATGPNTVFAVAEGGLLSVRDKDIRYVEIASSEDLRQLQMALDQDPAVREKYFGGPVETVVVDTFDEAARMIARERNLDKSQETLTQPDWGWFGDQLRASLRAFRNLDMNVIITCHTQEQKDEESGRITVRPQIQGGVRDELASYFDEVFLIKASTRTVVHEGHAVRQLYRILQTIPDTQHDYLKDRSGALPAEVELNLQDDFARLRHAIFGKAAVTPTPKLTKEEQVDRAKGAAKEPAVKEAAAKKEAAPKESAAAKAEPAKAEPAKKEADAAPAPEPTPPVAAATDGAGAAEAPQPEPEPTQLPPPPEADAPDAAEAPAAATETAAEPERPSEPAAEDATPAEVAPVAEAEGNEPDGATSEGAGTCEGCGGSIETKDQADLSRIRFRKELCVSCFRDAKSKKTA